MKVTSLHPTNRKRLPYVVGVGILLCAFFIHKYVNSRDSVGGKYAVGGYPESHLSSDHYTNERARGTKTERASRSSALSNNLDDLLKEPALNFEQTAKLEAIVNTIKIDAPASLVNKIFDSRIPYWDKPELVGILLRRVSKDRPFELASLLKNLPAGGASEEAIAKLFPFLDPFDMKSCNALIDSLPDLEWRSRAKDAVMYGYENRLRSGDLVFDQALANEINDLKIEAGEISLLKRRNELVAIYASEQEAGQNVAPNAPPPPSQKSTSPVRRSED